MEPYLSLAMHPCAEIHNASRLR